jgi:restriction system protein
MPIPGFQDLMLPLLQIAEDGNEHNSREVIEKLADWFQLTDEERVELLPSGVQARFDNRVEWVKTHLKKAGLLETTGRGRFKITERGIGVLQEAPEFINMKYLAQFAAYREFQRRLPQEVQETATREDVSSTPQEILEANLLETHSSLNEILADKVLDLVKSRPYSFLEGLIVRLLAAMGYGNYWRVTGRSGDGGIDGFIDEDKLGLDRIYVQAKRWDKDVGAGDVRDFVGALVHKRATKGVFITTSRFTRDATKIADEVDRKVILINGERLAELMIEYNVGISEKKTYVLKDVDKDFFGGE